MTGGRRDKVDPMESPVFSIVTPSFNSGRKLAATCSSVANQSVPYEHLIIDGASTDGSLILARELVATDKRVVLHSAPDKGVYDAMNTGIGLARGRYLFFLGAGDILHPDVLAKISKCLPPENSSFIYGDVDWLGKRYDGPFNAGKLFKKNICHQSIFYGRELFERLGLYSLEYKMSADWDFNFRCFADRNVRKRYVPVTVAVYEAGGFSTDGDADFWNVRESLYYKYFGPVRSFPIWGPKLWKRVRLGLGRRVKVLFGKVAPGFGNH